MKRTHTTTTTPETRSTRLAGTKGTQTPETQVVSREQMIAEAAYFRATQRGFASGGELDDWLAAEADVVRQFGEEIVESISK